MNRKTATLLVTASALALGTHSAHAAEVVFSSAGETEVQIGERVTQTSGVTQIKLDNGAMLSFVDGAEYQINADGTVDLFSGSVTVAGAEDGAAIIRMPDGAEGQVSGTGSAASFSVNAKGESEGHTLTGTAMVMRGRSEREFRAGEFWESSGRRGLRQVVASSTPAATPETPGQRERQVEVADMSEGGPVAAAQNGLPVSLGDALAAAGASSDILGAARSVDLAAGNPSLDTFPTGDLALLVAAAADLEGLNGGTPFPAAQADIIRTYLGFLADGGSGANFLTSYAGFLGQYLDLIRAGGLPSAFGAASLADINAFLGYSDRTGAIDALAAADQALANRYLAFLAGGGNVDQFSATFTDLVNAYFTFVRAGGDPDSFAGASQAVLDDYIAFLAASGLEQQLSDPDQTLLAAYNANGGLGFAREFQTALDAYFAFLQGGNLPSDFSETDLAVLQNYLEQLQASGLLGEFLGNQASFYADYLAFVQGGGNPDAFAGLNANIFAGFASDLDAYYVYLLNGGQPSAYEPLTQAQIAQYVAALQAQGVTGRFLDDLAGFYTDYAAFLAGGGNPDVFTGLPVLNLPAFADALNAYAAFLANGGLPTGFTATDLDVLANYVAALEAAGETDNLLGANADLVQAYFAFLAGGGTADLFPGLPLYASYVDALENYFAFLDNGGLPADFTALTPQQIQAFLTALGQAGGLVDQLGDLSGFYTQYFAFISAGGNPAEFAGLPVYATYAADLQSYFTFLAAGGLPADFTGLTQAQIADYLAALNAAGGFQQQIGGDAAAFFVDYFAFIGAGNDPATFAGLPVYASYVTQLNAYFAFLDNGGLPGDFTGLDQATIDAYLAALTGVTDGLGAFGELNGFFNAYASFVLGGGDPAEFAGLPIYATYVTQLNQYFAFLANGGLPADFTGLDAATIDAYLAALANVTGGLDAFAALNGDFDSYIAFLIGGGDPAEFAGLPVYSTYVTQLNAYFTFLAGGGLPEDYTVLDAATIEAYLAALTNVTGGLDSFGGLNSFFAAYSQFVLGGGDPEDFAGLPIYAEYLTAISEFYAFLLGGGVPSAFTGLTAQEVQDYLDALAGAGLLASTFDGEVLTFFNTYLAFLAGGGVPDQFDDLPGALDAVFNNAIVAQVSRNGFFNAAGSTAEIEPDGQITAMTIGTSPRTDYVATGDTLRERGRIGDIVAWTRYERGASSGGVTNFNTHLLAGNPATSLPASGLVNYNLIGGTAPTDAFGEAGSVGFFTGEVAVAYGATPRIGMELEIFAGARGWNASTNGGAANAASGGISIDDNNSFSLGLLTVGTLGDACAEGCGTTLTGGLFGEGASHLGFTYFLQDSPGSAGQSLVNGTAVFGTGGTAIGGLGTMPDLPPQGTGTPLLLNSPVDFAATSGVKFNLSSPTNVLNGFDVTTATFNADQGVTAIDDSFQPRSIGTASVTDISSNARFAIGRWTDGEYISANQFETTTLTSAQGFHYLLAAPTMGSFAVPTTGRIDYDLIAATAPTIADGSLAPGKFEADMAVLFGSTNRIAMEGSITLPTDGADYVYSFASDGGLANAEQSDSEFRVTFGRNVNFQFVDDQITTSDNTCDNTCVIQFGGYFAGEDINELGVTYTAQTGTFGQQISGAAIFGNGVYDDGSGGGGGVVDVPTNPILAYTGGFDASDAKIAFVASFNTFGGSESGFDATAYTLNANGGLTAYTRPNITRSIGSASLFEVSGNEDILIGRWADGTPNGVPNQSANKGFHYVLTRGVPDTFMLPASGTVHYDLLAATAPTIVDGSLMPGGVEADMALVFGATTRIAFEATFVMPSDGTNPQDVREYSTLGGIAAPEQSQNVLNIASNSTFSFNVPGIAGDNCSGATCQITARGQFGGDASQLGFIYNAGNGQGGAKELTGAMIFGTDADLGGGDMGGGTGSGFTGTRDGIVYYTYTNGSLSSAFGGSAALVDGALVSMTSALGTLSSENTTVVEAGDFGDIAWARWTDGDVAVPLFGTTSVGPNGGYHVMAGDASTTLPASGKVDYTLAATTSATDSIGSTPGTVTGSLAIQYGATNLVGYNMAMDVGGSSWAVATPGGSANPSQSNVNLVFGTAGPTFGGSFSGATSTVTAGGNACAITCLVTIAGAMYGDNGAYAGVAMNVFDGTTSASGLAIFAAPGADTSSLPATTANAGTIASAASTADWDRWSISEDAPLNTGTDMAIAPGIEALQMRGVQFTPEQIQKLEAHLAAQVR